MKVYLIVKDATVKSIYDPKMKAKVIAQIGKSAKAALAKGKEVSLSKPTGWKKEKDKGFSIVFLLESLTKSPVKSEIHFSAKIKALLLPLHKGQPVNKFPIGTGTVKNSVTKKKLDDEAVYIAGAVTANLVKDKVLALIKTL